MVGMHCLDKYRLKLLRNINSDFGKVVSNPEREPVHDFRVGVKRMTALYNLIIFIKPEIKSLKIIKPYRKIFKSIGIIREYHIAQLLTNEFCREENMQSRSIIRNLKSRERSAIARYYRTVDHENVDKIHMPTIRSLGVSEHHIARRVKVFLAKTLDQLFEETKGKKVVKWHRKRILLKRYHHTLHSLQYCTAYRVHEDELKQIRILEQLLGDWHDRLVTIQIFQTFRTPNTGINAINTLFGEQANALLAVAHLYLRKFHTWHHSATL